MLTFSFLVCLICTNITARPCVRWMRWWPRPQTCNHKILETTLTALTRTKWWRVYSWSPSKMLYGIREYLHCHVYVSQDRYYSFFLHKSENKSLPLVGLRWNPVSFLSCGSYSSSPRIPSHSTWIPVEFLRCCRILLSVFHKLKSCNLNRLSIEVKE